MILRLNKSLPFPLPLSLCLPLSLSLCLHLCLNSCLYLTLPLNLKLSFCLCLWLCLCLFQGKSQIGWGFVFASVSVLVFGRRKSSFLLFSDYPDRGQTVDPEAKIPRLILRLDEPASERTATNDGSVKIPELKQIQPKNFSKSRLKRSSKSMLSSSNKPCMVFPPYPKSSGTRFCFGIQENTPRQLPWGAQANNEFEKK